jgi:hypothetical protein
MWIIGHCRIAVKSKDMQCSDISCIVAYRRFALDRNDVVLYIQRMMKTTVSLPCEQEAAS